MNIQQNVHEFLLNLIDKLENRLQSSENKNLIKFFFQGKILDEITFKNIFKSIKEKTKSFFALELQIKNSFNLLDSLKWYLKKILDEGNEIYFDKSKRKIEEYKKLNLYKFPIEY